MAVAEPFGRGLAQHVADWRASPRTPARAWSKARSPRSTTRAARRSPAAGDRLSYDALVVAVGARAEPALQRALTWTPEADAEVFGGLLRDIEEGYSKQVAFVVPVGVAWPLPAYELALMTAWEADSMGRDDLEITIYTPRERAARGVRRRGHDRAARGPRRRRHRGGDRRLRAGRRGRAAGGRAGRAAARRRARRRAAARGRPGAARAAVRRSRLHQVRPSRQGRRRRARVGRGRRDRVPGQAGRAGLAAGRRGRRGDRRPRRRGRDAAPVSSGPARRAADRAREGVAAQGGRQRRGRGGATGAVLAADEDRRALSLAVPERCRARDARPSGQPVDLDLERDLPAAADALRDG